VRRTPARQLSPQRVGRSSSVISGTSLRHDRCFRAATIADLRSSLAGAGVFLGDVLGWMSPAGGWTFAFSSTGIRRHWLALGDGALGRRQQPLVPFQVVGVHLRERVPEPGIFPGAFQLHRLLVPPCRWVSTRLAWRRRSDWRKRTNIVVAR